MKVIEFRAWDRKIKKYRSEGTVHITGDGSIFILKVDQEYGDIKYENIDEIDIEQFTNLRDLYGSGKKVYDGDRFKDGGVVVWIKDGWFVHFKSYDVPLNEYLYNDNSRETVGTIHNAEEPK